MWCISVRTSFCALRPYFRPRERERDVERWERELRDDARREFLREEERLDLAVERCDRELRRLELRLFAILTSPHQTPGPCYGLAQKRAYSFRINGDG